MRSAPQPWMRCIAWKVCAWSWLASSWGVEFASVVAAFGNFVRLDGGVGTEPGNCRGHLSLVRIQAGKVLAHGVRQGVNLVGTAVDLGIDGIGAAACQTLGHRVERMHTRFHASLSGSDRILAQLHGVSVITLQQFALRRRYGNILSLDVEIACSSDPGVAAIGGVSDNVTIVGDRNMLERTVGGAGVAASRASGKHRG